MAADCIPAYSFTAKMEENAAQEAAAAGFQSVDKLIRLLSTSNKFQAESTPDVDCRAVVDVAVNKFKKFISILDRCRTGHARFRRGPIQINREKVEPDLETAGSPPRALPAVDDSPCTKIQYPTPVQRLLPLPHQLTRNGSSEKKEMATTINFGSPANSFRPALTSDTDSLQQSMSSGFQITHLGRPPLSISSLKRKCTSMDDSNSKCGGGSTGSRCHCPKKRKSKVKRVERVAAISMKMADIPPDDFSWRKYGQKPIKGSPHPRGYYRCSSVKGCAARKHVERALDDPNMLIVTYEAEHNHPHPNTQALVLESS
ncbi:putative WRKY transcription factor 7 [Primulina tabacum]|uniref:putative WRKY transcription factor 7 n=1 Tax=Primulina tabacum TaxID=48773 RepID=UPI003F59806A